MSEPGAKELGITDISPEKGIYPSMDEALGGEIVEALKTKGKSEIVIQEI